GRERLLGSAASLAPRQPSHTRLPPSTSGPRTIIDSTQRVSSDVMRGRCSSSDVATSVAPLGENGHISTSDAHTASAQMKATSGTAPVAASGTANVTSAASVPVVDANAEINPA